MGFMAALMSGRLGLQQTTTDRDWDGFARWVLHYGGVGSEMGLSRLSLSQFLFLLLFIKGVNIVPEAVSVWLLE